MSAKKEKMVIYQALVRLFGNNNLNRVPWGSIGENGCGKMSDFNVSALASIKKLGCNYIWYTGLLQQASATDYSAYGIPRQNPEVLKGVAGSPYAISDYYSVCCDLADDPARRMEEFDELVNRTHKAGLKMIIDFVPNHVARHYESVTAPKGVRDLGADDNTQHCFNPQNNFYYCNEPLHMDNVNGGGGTYQEMPAKVSGNDVFNAWPSRNDWYETVKLNYGVDYCGGGRYCFDPIPDTWHKMLHILKYWCAKGVDGFRCDMVFMVPVDFWHWAIAQVKKTYPRVVFIGEIYDPSIYRSYIEYGGFDYLYDKVGLYDTLRAVVECRESASAITRCWQSVEGIQDKMLNFLENHDEQRIASDFFAGDARKAIPALVVSALMNTNPFMLYFGQEVGERGMDEEGFSGRDGRTTIFDYWALESMNKYIGEKKDYRPRRLGKEARELRELYATLLNICNECAPVQRGSFYDLMYCNCNNPGFDIHRQYAFLRHFGREIVLVVANFDPEEKNMSINIPAEAWRFVDVESRNRHFENLLTGEWSYGYHDITQPMEVKVPGYGALVLRMQNR
ncbi:MAG: alpha-amylase [Bacteroidales bacterium]|nr:alpha-amylase [Candidatus Liminaster caballi]